MATEKVKIDIDINVDTNKPAKSLGELTKQLKTLKTQLDSAAGADFSRLSEELNDVEGKIGDINDTAKLASGSGVEKLTNSFGALKEGLLSADPGKLKIGLKGLGAAMDAIPIFLLIEGLKFLWDNFDKVKEILFAIFPALDSVSQSTKKLEAANKKLAESNSVLINTLENSLKIAEAQGKSDGELLKIKKEIFAAKLKELEQDIILQKSKLRDVVLNDDLLEGANRLYAAFLRKTGQEEAADLYDKIIMADKISRSKEFTDKIKEDELALANLKTEIKVEEIKVEKKAVETSKKIQEDKKIQAEKDGEENYQKYKAEQQRLLDEDNVVVKSKVENINIVTQAELDAAAKLNESALAQDALDKQTAKDKLASDAAINQAELKGIEAAQSLTAGYFAWKSRAAKGNAAEELKIKKQMFAVDKAFNLARAIQDGIRSVQAALTIPPPGGQILAVVNAAIAAGNVAKIAASQFDGGGSGGGGSVSAPSGGGGSVPTGPAQFGGATLEKIGGDFNSPNGLKTSGGSGNKTQPIQAYVVSQDVTSSQDKSATIERRAAF